MTAELLKTATSRIDWESVHKKLKANQEALERVFDVDPEHNAQVFRQRAQRMAARNYDAKRVETVAVMSFMIGTERYGILLSELAEIRPCINITPVPGTPSELYGVVSVRGEIRSVIDLAKVLGVSVAETEDDKSYMLLLKGEAACFALRVTQVNQVENFEKSAVEASYTAQTSLLGHYLKGVSDGSLIFLNLAPVLSHPIFKGIS